MQGPHIQYVTSHLVYEVTHVSDEVTIVRQCTATNKAGVQCKKNSMLGQRICRAHGGSAPQCLAAARDYMATELLPPSLRTVRAAIQDRVCPTCGRGGNVQAAFGVMDRVGLHPKVTLETQATQDDLWLELATPEEADAIHAIMHRCIERMRDEGLRVPGDAIDITPETNRLGEQSNPTPYSNRADAFDAHTLPTPRTSSTEADVNAAHSAPIDDDDVEEFDVPE